MTTSWTIESVKTAIAAKKVSARELAAEHFKRIAARNGELNAYLTLSEERAYAQADKIDAAVAAGGKVAAVSGGGGAGGGGGRPPGGGGGWGGEGLVEFGLGLFCWGGVRGVRG